MNNQFALKTRETLTSIQTPHYTFTNHILIELCQNLSRYQFNDGKLAAQVIKISSYFIFTYCMF